MLELLVVLALGMLMLTIVVPVVPGLFSADPLRQTGVSVGGMIERVKRCGVESADGCLLIIDPGGRTLRVKSHVPGEDPLAPDAAARHSLNLPDPVVIGAVRVGSIDRDLDEPVTVWANRRGMLEPVEIVVSDGEGTLSLSHSPFLPRLSVAVPGRPSGAGKR